MTQKKNSKDFDINILEGVKAPSTPLTRLLAWALSWGRYIVVFTELIVILAFLSRFKLDQQITDLEETIAQKTLIIQASQPLETTIIATQNKIANLKDLDRQSRKPQLLIDLLNQNTPSEITLINLGLTQTSFNLTAAGSEAGLASLVNQLKSSPNIKEVAIQTISRADQSFPVNFIIKADYDF